jgi:mono/diheme cytochrome c family protein
VTIAAPSLKAEHNPGVVLMAEEVGPSHMPSFARVLSVPEMRAVADYVSGQLATMPLGGGDVTDGGKLFRIYCAACHQTAARGGAIAIAGVNAPDITDISPAIVAGVIRWGPGPMPSFPPGVLDDKQLASIVDYVEFLQQAPKPGGSSLNWYGPTAEGFVAWIFVLGLIVTTVWIEKGGKG